MNPTDRYVLLGLARAHADWFVEVARWSNSGALPAEFVKVLSVEEVRARLQSGRTFSALLVDATAPGCDADLVHLAEEYGCRVVVVDDRPNARDWSRLGAAAVLRSGFERAELLRLLRTVAAPVARAEVVAVAAPPPADEHRGRIVAVTGAGGVGRSTLAMALASGLAARNGGDHLRPSPWHRWRSSSLRDEWDVGDVRPRVPGPSDDDGGEREGRGVVLADLALHAQQGLLHDAGDVVPGLSELVEAHRHSALAAHEVRELCFEVPDRGYDVLLGLRRQRDWVPLRRRSLRAAFAGLGQAYRLVVADVDCDVEGETECGSVEVEDRNMVARTALQAADLVVVVGAAGVPGVHSHVRVLRDLLQFGVAPDRILPLVNRAPRHPRARAELARALAELVGAAAGSSTALAAPVFVGERRRLDDLHRDGHGRVPAPIVAAVTVPVRALLDRLPPVSDGDGDPVTVSPGSLGVWSPHGEEALS